MELRKLGRVKLEQPQRLSRPATAPIMARQELHILSIVTMVLIQELVAADCSTQSHIPVCSYEVEHHFDTYLTSFAMKISINTTECCTIDLIAILTEEGALHKEPSHTILHVVCEYSIHIRVHVLNNCSQKQNQDTTLCMELDRCSTRIEDIGNIARYVGLRSLMINSGSIQCCRETLEVNKVNDELNDLNIIYIIDGSFEDVFSCGIRFQNVVEFKYTGNISSIPPSITSIFPTLQYLDMSFNMIEFTPNWTWSSEYIFLPEQFGRTPLMQEKYLISKYLDIPNNLYRKGIDLSNNRIHDGSSLHFSGPMHVLRLRSNGLSNLNKNAFVEIENIQYLDLSDNNIKELPTGVFRGQSKLRKLDLSRNKLENLNEADFSELSSLKLLDISSNTIRCIASNTISKLRSLETLNVQNNFLRTISFLPFSGGSILKLKLKYLNVKNNPIEKLPEALFWLPSLQIANFAGSKITLNTFFDDIDKLKILRLIYGSVDFENDNLVNISNMVRKIDLEGCNVTRLKLNLIYENIPRTDVILQLVSYLKLRTILTKFQFILSGNHLICDCTINNIVLIIKHLPTFTHNLFDSWICSWPPEHLGTKVIDIKPEVTYCILDVQHCPLLCTCYQRSTSYDENLSQNIIVDCRDRQLSDLNYILPEGRLELWLDKNNISTIGPFVDLSKVSALNVSQNHIQSISSEVFVGVTKMMALDIRSNQLRYLPESIKNVRIEVVYLSNNDFQCDCHSLWMKQWIITNRNAIKDWSQLYCNTLEEKTAAFVDVKDEDFICVDETHFDSFKHVLIPSLVCTVSGVLFILIAAMTYIYRVEIKVWLFIHFGIHPFDRTHASAIEHVDCTILHSESLTEWVMETLVKKLENDRDSRRTVVVKDCFRDFIPGFSFQENVSRSVYESKRVIFILSKQWIADENEMTVAWNIVKNKLKKNSLNFAIIVVHQTETKSVEDMDIGRFIKARRYIDSSKSLLYEKILYDIPQVSQGSQSVDEHFSNLIPKCNGKPTAFVSYGENDVLFAAREILDPVSECGYQVCFPDRDFQIGAPKQENILQSVNKSRHTIFIMSPNHVSDEWSMFTFRAAQEKSLRLRYNHLIVVVRDMFDFNNEIKDMEMKHYMKNYTYLRHSDKWFKTRLLRSLTAPCSQ
ncbi:TOLL-like protein [Mya arenaria]|uniref:TOLL-like protein n=1 Tax=Mya arenaria TaxID=6604 RepID=A0ABY7G5B2_MYAAR|nr:TOLL-like protein [Mya arenaria]